jgi:uncharacterized protein YjbJ (UPF0337 family)
MMSKHERSEGKVEEVVGAAQKAKQLRGRARQKAARAARRLEGLAQELMGVVKSFAGRVVGNEAMQFDGLIAKITGATRKRLNR